MGGANPAASDASAALRATTPPAVVAEVQMMVTNGVAVAVVAEATAAANTAIAAPLCR